mgnify:CR=1 FL=1
MSHHHYQHQQQTTTITQFVHILSQSFHVFLTLIPVTVSHSPHRECLTHTSIGCRTSGTCSRGARPRPRVKSHMLRCRCRPGLGLLFVLGIFVSFRFVSFECGCAREWERVRRKFESPKLQNQKAELNQRVTTKQAEKRRRRRSKMCVTSRTVRLHYT